MARGPQRGFFDLWSLVYDAPWVQRLTYRPEQDAVVRALAEDDPRRVLDLGCGTGRLASRLARGDPDLRVVGCDFSRGMLAEAVARTRSVAWVQGDAGALPFRDGSFQAVVSTEAFHWFPDPDRALGELRRVLAPGGRLLVALVNPPLDVLSDVSHRVSALLGEPMHWPTRAAMRARVESAGFRVEDQRSIFRLPFPVVFPSVLTVARRP
jgi:ubiquinone/menaquinone biosynthesis C-methylase UbiE